MNKPLIFVFFLSLLGGACYFEPSGNFYKDIPPRDYSGVAIDLFNVTDTIYVGTVTKFICQMQLDGFAFDKALVSVDGTPVDQVGGNGGSFYLHPEQFSTGNHTMTIDLIVASGTGSIADRYGIEQKDISRSFIIYVDNSAPEPIDIIKLDTTQGTMTLRWNAYHRRNFEHYIIHKTLGYSNTSFVYLSNQSANSWSDSSYVGGTVRYQIEISANARETWGKALSYSYYPRGGFEIRNKIAYVHWRQPLFYRNVTRVWMSDNNLVSEMRALNDTTFQAGPLLAGLGFVRLRFESALPENAVENDVPYYLGTRYPLPSFWPFFYNPKVKIYYLRDVLNNGYLTGDEQLKIVSGQEYGYTNLSLSGNGSYVVGTGKYGDYQNLYVVDLTNLDGTNPITLGLAQTVSVGNNALVASMSDSSRVVALAGYHTIYRAIKSPAGNLISPSGQYLFDNGGLLKYDGTFFQPIGSIDPAQLDFFRFDRNDNLVLFYHGGIVKVFEMPTVNLVRTFNAPFSPEQNLTYDPVSDRFLVSNYYGSTVINAVAGTSKIVSNKKATLVNGKVFTNEEFFGIVGVGLTELEP